jgi:hypothetical protein
VTPRIEPGERRDRRSVVLGVAKARAGFSAAPRQRAGPRIRARRCRANVVDPRRLRPCRCDRVSDHPWPPHRLDSGGGGRRHAGFPRRRHAASPDLGRAHDEPAAGGDRRHPACGRRRHADRDRGEPAPDRARGRPPAAGLRRRHGRDRRPRSRFTTPRARGPSTRPSGLLSRVVDHGTDPDDEPWPEQPRRRLPERPVVGCPLVRLPPGPIRCPPCASRWPSPFWSSAAED